MRFSANADGNERAARFAAGMEDLERHWHDALARAGVALDAVASAHGLPGSEIAARRRALDQELAWVARVDWSRYRERSQSIAALVPRAESRRRAALRHAA
jgi:hypothetical protein